MTHEVGPHGQRALRAAGAHVFNLQAQRLVEGDALFEDAHELSRKGFVKSIGNGCGQGVGMEISIRGRPLTIADFARAPQICSQNRMDINLHCRIGLDYSTARVVDELVFNTLSELLKNGLFSEISSRLELV